MNITTQLTQLSTTEKIRTMEYLWDDLCHHADELSSPEWHGDMLTQRKQLVAGGDAVFHDWEAEKSRIRSLLK